MFEPKHSMIPRKPDGAVDVPAFLFALSEQLHNLTTPLAIIDVTVAMVGRYLHADRVGYCEIEHDSGMIHYLVGWSDGILEPLGGRQPIVAQLGEALMALYHAGRRSYARDTDEDALAVPGSLSAVGARAMMAAPLIRDGVWSAGLFVNQATVRDWLPEGTANRSCFASARYARRAYPYAVSERP